MKKFDFPTAENLLDRKILFYKREHVWQYLEREMREKEKLGIKPYNEKVGNWLKFLRDMKYYNFIQGKRHLEQLEKESGPPWFHQFSHQQKSVLTKISFCIYKDTTSGRPNFTARALHDLGITIQYPKRMLLAAMLKTDMDPGIFLWQLFSYYYKVPPSEGLTKYDMNARIHMSAIVFIDIDECIQTLDKLTTKPHPKPSPEVQKKAVYYEPKVKFGQYLQKLQVPCSKVTKLSASRRKKPPPFDYSIKLKSEEIEEVAEKIVNLAKATTHISIQKRKDRIVKVTADYRHAKKGVFWEAPSYVRTRDPKKIAYLKALKMFKTRPRRLKKIDSNLNTQYVVSGVCYSAGKPRYKLDNLLAMSTTNLVINGCVVIINGNIQTTLVLGHVLYPRNEIDSCESECSCLEKMEDKVKEYLKNSKCKCGHRYDLGHKRNRVKKVPVYFTSPTKHHPMFIDYAKIMQMDSTDEFIRKTIQKATRSDEGTPVESYVSIEASSLPIKTLLSIFLCDIMDSALLLPHLPEANRLLSLKAWTRKRLKGDYSAKKTHSMIRDSQRRWSNLDHLHLTKTRPYMIPWTKKELEHINYSHRPMIQYLHETLNKEFRQRSAKKQLNEARLLWSTFKNDMYPSERFLETFYCYMPSKQRDVHMLNPYDQFLTPRCAPAGKTCPLEKIAYLKG